MIIIINNENNFTYIQFYIQQTRKNNIPNSTLAT